MILGPTPCQGCRRPVVWSGKVWRDPGRKNGRHACIGRVRCGAYMPLADARCDRFLGHAPGHKSRYAMDNDLRAKGRAA